MDSRAEWFANSANWSDWAGKSIRRLWGTVAEMPDDGVIGKAWAIVIPDTPEGRQILMSRPPW